MAFALAIAASLAVLFLPLYTSETISAGSRDPDSRRVTEQLTLLEVNGPAIFVPLLIPVLLTGLPLLLRGKAWRGLSLAATVLLAVFAVLGLASIGWFYLPALFASAGALLVRPAKRPPPTS
ncbi:hypothetical protein GCM10023081_01210 [Arthrobacter ginkgonis]|uniref:Uncharacterized protein n=1 Tax=Arthrobacter ginkgonis TaxID=1630594 RepID=A0ABP7BSS5_9MICC